MDIDAFNALIAMARETAVSLTQAEQRVAAFKVELAEQAKDAEQNAGAAPVRAIRSIPKRASGWLPAMEKLPKAS
jgi:mRNA-degrading endonuclease toxin of MazEF toxin-antitoxin module